MCSVCVYLSVPAEICLPETHQAESVLNAGRLIPSCVQGLALEAAGTYESAVEADTSLMDGRCVLAVRHALAVHTQSEECVLAVRHALAVHAQSEGCSQIVQYI